MPELNEKEDRKDAIVGRAPADGPIDPCSDGVVKDDGAPESGYGFVPSAVWGEHVQRFHSTEFGSREIAEVCVCWLKTRGDHDADFDVVFYRERNGEPEDRPYATAAAHAENIPTTKETAGRFYSALIDGVTLPKGASFIGVRWNPSKEKFLFVCTDTSAGTEPTEAFYRDDRAKGWTSVLSTRDSSFRDHRAILVRPVARTD